MPNILEVDHLVKNYGTFTAVNDVSFSVPKGKVIGFLGPNGAGKTTTIQILLGITTPTSGSIKFFDKDFSKNREYCLKKINYTSAFNTLQGRISIYENLLVFAALYEVANPQKKINDLLEYFEIVNIRNSQYWGLSAGQKTRVNIIKSLLNDPQLILMDEPTASLDPDIADKTLSLIEELKEKQHITLLYTSHNMDEISRICDEVIFLDHGKIVAQDTPLGLTKKIQKAELHITFDKDKEKLTQYLTQEKLTFKFHDLHNVHIEIEEKNIPKVIFGISNADIWITNLEVKKPTLENVFLQIARGEVY